MKKMNTIPQRIEILRARFSLRRTQLFTERGELILQGVQLHSGAKGCAWKPERGESMHDAINEAEELLQNR